MTRLMVTVLWGLALMAVAIGCGTSPPTVPQNVVANAVSSSEIDVSWDESTDFGEIDKYRVYRNGSFYIRVKGTEFRDSGLQNSTEYCYRIRAIDEEGNRSEKSDRACATTFGITNSITNSVVSTGQ